MVTGLNFSSDNSLLITSSLDHSLRVKRLINTGILEEDLVFREKDLWIRNLSISPDNNYAVSVGQSGLIQVWPLTTECALKEIIGIERYLNFLKGTVNESGLKAELGNELFESLWKFDEKNKNFNELWESLKINYLN
jgi:WD40 repeat protein